MLIVLASAFIAGNTFAQETPRQTLAERIAGQKPPEPEVVDPVRFVVNSRHLMRETASTGTREPLRAAAFSPDGETLAVASENVVQLISVKGAMLHRLDGFGEVVSSVAFSPDGELVAAGSFDQTVRVWNVESGELVCAFAGHTNWVRCVAFSADSRRVASGGYDKSIRIWNSASGELEHQLKAHTAAVHSLAFSSDGRFLASGSADNTIKLWKADTFTELKTLRGHNGGVRAVAFSPVDPLLASASEDRTAKLWSVPDGVEVERSLGRHDHIVLSVAFSPLGSRLVTGGFDKGVRVWDTAGGSLRQSMSGHSDVVTAVAISPDGRSLLTASLDRTLRLWPAEVPAIDPLQTIRGEVTFATISPDQRSLVIAERNGPFITLRDIITKKVRTRLEGHAGGATQAAFSSDGKRLVTAGLDRAIRLWDMEGETELAAKQTKEPSRALAMSPDDTRLAVGDAAGSVTVFEISDATLGDAVMTLAPQKLPITQITFSPDGKRLATSTGDYRKWREAGEVKLWDAATGSEIAAIGHHAGEVKGVRFSPNGKRLVTFGSFNSVRVWDVETRSQVAAINQRGNAVAACFLSDDHLLVGGANGSLTRIAIGRPGEKTFRFAGHTRAVQHISISRDLSLAVSVSQDGTIKSWSVADLEYKRK
jgi:WD40 repeat protein